MPRRDIPYRPINNHNEPENLCIPSSFSWLNTILLLSAFEPRYKWDQSGIRPRNSGISFPLRPYRVRGPKILLSVGHRVFSQRTKRPERETDKQLHLVPRFLTCSFTSTILYNKLTWCFSAGTSLSPSFTSLGLSLLPYKVKLHIQWLVTPGWILGDTVANVSEPRETSETACRSHPRISDIFSFCAF
jgi:hypothetical protein